MYLFRDKFPSELATWRTQRAIGVVYRSPAEHDGNYVPTALPRRYDAFVFLERTSAVRALTTEEGLSGGEPPETYPSGM